MVAARRIALARSPFPRIRFAVWKREWIRSLIVWALRRFMVPLIAFLSCSQFCRWARMAGADAAAGVDCVLDGDMSVVCAFEFRRVCAAASASSFSSCLRRNGGMYTPNAAPPDDRLLLGCTIVFTFAFLLVLSFTNF